MSASRSCMYFIFTFVLGDARGCCSAFQPAPIPSPIYCHVQSAVWLPVLVSLFCCLCQKVNAGQRGFFKVNYTDKGWANLSR